MPQVDLGSQGESEFSYEKTFVPYRVQTPVCSVTGL